MIRANLCDRFEALIDRFKQRANSVTFTGAASFESCNLIGMHMDGPAKFNPTHTTNTLHHL